uniref:Uncharacterized protein n=1 Tax=Megaselia scalaris TaxID=36166 RepID=T1H1C1_MEGSC
MNSTDMSIQWPHTPTWLNLLLYSSSQIS